jgi:predicted dehydrogenase
MKTKSYQLKAAVIGLGQIGMGYDYQSQNSRFRMTHCSAYHYHSDFELIAGVDPNADLIRAFEKKYASLGYKTVEQLFEKHALDVVSICVPTDYHYITFKKVAESGIHNILLEKPIAATLQEAKKIAKIAEKKKIRLLINYIRRFDPGILQLKTDIEKGEWGEIEKVSVWYSKGMLNNASHFIDLLIFLLGEIEKIEVINDGRLLENQDIEPDFQLKFDNGSIAYFLAAKEENFSLLEVEIITEKGRIRLINGGEEIETWKVSADPVYPGYRILKKLESSYVTEFNQYQHNVLHSFVTALRNKQPFLSNETSALESLKVVNFIQEQLKRK